MHSLHEFHTGLGGRSSQERQLSSRTSHLFAESSKSYEPFPIFSFCLRCKDHWLIPTTERNAIFRTTYMGRQTSSMFVYSQYEKIHREQSEFVSNDQDGRISRALDWKTLPLTLSWIDKRYTGCNRRNGPDFGRVLLMLNYTEKPQNTYIQSWTVWEIIASEVRNFDSCYTLTDYQIRIETGRNMWFL